MGVQDTITQEGDVPPPCYGGQLTVVGSGDRFSEAIFSGGMIQTNMDADPFDVLTKDINLYEEKCLDGLYILRFSNLFDKFVWEKMTVRIPSKISFHNAVFLPSRKKIILFGSIFQKDDDNFKRMPVDHVFSLDCSNSTEGGNGNIVYM